MPAATAKKPMVTEHEHVEYGNPQSGVMEDDQYVYTIIDKRERGRVTHFIRNKGYEKCDDPSGVEVEPGDPFQWVRKRKDVHQAEYLESIKSETAKNDDRLEQASGVNTLSGMAGIEKGEREHMSDLLARMPGQDPDPDEDNLEDA